MSRAPAKTKASEPPKVDPAALAPTPEAAMIGAKASRPTFRRGGQVFNDRDWTALVAEEVGEEAMLAILADPVLTIQARTRDGWRLLSMEERRFRIDGPAAD